MLSVANFRCRALVMARAIKLQKITSASSPPRRIKEKKRL